MKYSDSISSIFVISIITLMSLLVGNFILDTLHFQGWWVLIPYGWVLLYSTFKSKNWNIVFGLLLALVHVIGLFFILMSSFS